MFSRKEKINFEIKNMVNLQELVHGSQAQTKS